MFKERQNIDLIGDKNLVLMERIEAAIDDLTDDEYLDLLEGNRGSLLTLRNGEGSFKLCEATCICGNTDNVPCQWLRAGDKCDGVFCGNYIRRNK